jgi:hypothetical protein
MTLNDNIIQLAGYENNYKLRLNFSLSEQPVAELNRKCCVLFQVLSFMVEMKMELKWLGFGKAGLTALILHEQPGVAGLY